MADVQAVCGAVEPDVPDDALARCDPVQLVQVGRLVDEAALDHGAGELGPMPAHGKRRYRAPATAVRGLTCTPLSR